MSTVSDDVPKEKQWPILPPSEFCFDTVLMRELLGSLQFNGYAKHYGGSVHAAVFQRYLRRFVDCVDETHGISWEAFAPEKSKVWLTWEDIRPGVIKQGVPSLSVRLVERVMLTLEDPSSSMLAMFYLILSTAFIVISIFLVVMGSFLTSPEEKEMCNVIDKVCVFYFTGDYLAKLICSPWVRTAMIDREFHLAAAVPKRMEQRTWNKAAKLTPAGRIHSFLTKSSNLVDLISILPFWLGEIFPNLPGLTFLRAVRLARLGRVFKRGRFKLILGVLATSIGESTQMVYVILIYVTLICIMAGSILNGFESAPAFETVPTSAWWVASRVIVGGHRSMHGVDEKVYGMPVTELGALMMIAVFVVKGVIWILPFAHMQSTFKEEWQKAQVWQKMNADVVHQDHMGVELAWTHDNLTAVAPVEIWEVLGDSDQGVLAGRGQVQVPILLDRHTSGLTTTQLYGGAMDHWFGGKPEMDFMVKWSPTKVLHDGGSCGSLSITPLVGRQFRSGTAGAQWRCKVQAPMGSYAKQIWVSEASVAGETSEPSWSNSPSAAFEVVLHAQTRGELRNLMQTVQVHGEKVQHMSESTADLHRRALALEQSCSQKK